MRGHCLVTLIRHPLAILPLQRKLQQQGGDRGPSQEHKGPAGESSGGGGISAVA